MKRILKNSLLIGAAVLGVSSVGIGSSVVKAATTPPTTNVSADITPGTITLDSEPAINFGTVASSASDTTYKSTAMTGDLHVTNPGEATGWSVSVADSPFTDTTSSNTLKGAVLSLDDSTTAPLKADATDNVSALPTFNGALTLSGTASNILNAPAGAGIGAYTASYGNTDASLMVPAGNAGGSYSSTLTWTLSNAPS